MPVVVRMHGSRVTEESFEAEVHVVLDVAVEEAEAGLVRGELDGGAAIEGDHYGVLDQARCGLAVNVDQLELGLGLPLTVKVLNLPGPPPGIFSKTMSMF
jgi:hypothetical protein